MNNTVITETELIPQIARFVMDVTTDKLDADKYLQAKYRAIDFHKTLIEFNRNRYLSKYVSSGSIGFESNPTEKSVTITSSDRRVTRKLFFA